MRVAFKHGDQDSLGELRPMASHYQSKIASKMAAEGSSVLGSFGDLGPGDLAIAEWRDLGLELPDVDTMRAYRLERVREQLRIRDCAAALLTDPLNVRYATDSTNMQLWCTHNPVRYAFIATEGPVILFDYHGSMHLSDHLSLINEVRAGTSFFYFATGDGTAAAAKRWAAEIAALVKSHGGGSRRLAVDKVDPLGAYALEQLGIEITDGQEVTELARVIKSPDELRAMRCAIAACEAGMAAMEAHLQPGITEQNLWAHLHAENIKRGGEWIETRLLASGKRTNPWFAECSSKVIEAGEIVAFDTDLIGPYGYCADISRTWISSDKPTPRQEAMYRLASDQIAHNIDLLCPGLGFLDFAWQSFQLPNAYLPNRYSAVIHGVGLCDEYPHIGYAEDAEYAYDGTFEAGMTICVESYVGEVGGPDGIKLEQQVLITENGAELLSPYPLDANFLT